MVTPDERSIIIRAVNELLLSLRSNVDRASNRELNDAESNKNARKRIYLRIESARYSFSRSPYATGELRSGDLSSSLKELIREIDEIINDDYFSILNQIPYRPHTSTNNRTRRNFIIEFEERLISQKLSVADAIQLLYNRAIEIKSLVDQQASLFDVNSSEIDIKTIIPNQKIAPLKFGIENGILVIEPQISRSNPEDLANINAAKDDIITRGDFVIDELKRSNCDRRLLENIEYLQSQIKVGENIIQSGLANIGCGMLIDVYREELPDALSAMLKAHTMSVSMYVGQFPEWAKFVENAAVAEIDNADISRVFDATSKVVEALQANSKSVDPEVPASLKRLGALISDPQNASRRAAFAVIRSLENLIIKIFSYSSDLIDQTAKKTATGLATVASAAIVAGLLSLAVSSATDLGPLAAKVKELSWMKSALEVVQRQLDQLAK